MTATTPPPFETVPCECCGATQFAVIREWNSVSKIARCLGCGLEFVNPLPGEEYLRELYLRETQSGDPANPYYRNYIRERVERRSSYARQFHEKLKLIERFAGTGGKILDIGCGAGFFLDAARSRGWSPYGIDIVPEFTRFANERLKLQNVSLGNFEAAQFSSGFFDVVTLWDLIEHLRHPLAYLRDINKILRPGGAAVIGTPNVANAAYLQERWQGYDIGQHLYFFSAHTLQGLLTRSGFREAYKKTTRAKKGFFPQPPPIPYDQSVKPATGAGKLWYGMKRDLKNLVNPLNYLSPVLDMAGYGFNLFVLAVKEEL